MHTLLVLALALLWQTYSSAPASSTPAPKPAVATGTSPQYEGAKLLPPVNYREWIYLSTGLDMDYNPQAQAMGHSMFDNVFVNPEAYKAFQQTGTWPDKTMLVLEVRGTSSKGSINKAGHFQTGNVMGLAVHVKDSAHGGWAFYGFNEEQPAEAIPHKTVCYSCHEQHAAVDTTFVQFYPTLLETAKQKGTLSAEYVKESAAEAK